MDENQKKDPKKVNDMFALAMLFAVIIGLLGVVVRLLRNFFDTYNRLLDAGDAATDRENTIRDEHTALPCQQIDAVVSARMSELEQKFPTSQAQQEVPERIIAAFKQLILSSLNLFKITEKDNRCNEKSP